jgi:hypothetical protein
MGPSFRGVPAAGLPGSNSGWPAPSRSPRSASIQTKPWNANNYGATTFTFDLSNMPGNGMNLLGDLQANRFLDVVVTDDTSVDYRQLLVEFCKCCCRQRSLAAKCPTPLAPGAGQRRWHSKGRFRLSPGERNSVWLVELGSHSVNCQ